jgi:parvulin-like peptidyl-prolyl isomerase
MTNPGKMKDMKREALDQLIRVELLWQEAKTAGVVASDDDVDRTIAEARERFRSTDAFVRRIEQSGFTEATYREHTRKVLSGERIAERIVERDVQVTDSDIEEFYKINPRLFRRDEQLKARHILAAVPQGATAEQRDPARKKILELAARARAGENFETLARNHSDDATKQWGGELDAFSRGQMAKSFDDAAFALRPGEISGVVETASGFHIIRVEQRLPAIEVPFEQARERIRDYLRGTRGKEAIDREVQRLRATGKIEVLTPL